MPEPIVEIRILNAREIQAKLQDPDFIGVPIKQLLPRVRQLGLNVARSVLAGRGTGLAHQSLSATYSIPAKRVRIFSKMAIARALSIEQGTPIGTKVPLGRLITWRRATGDNRSAEQIQQDIIRGGAPPKRFLGQAAEAIQARMPEYIKELADKFRQKWAA